MQEAESKFCATEKQIPKDSGYLHTWRISFLGLPDKVG